MRRNISRASRGTVETPRDACMSSSRCGHLGFNAALCTQPAVVKTAEGYRADTQVVSPQELLQGVSKSEMF